MEVIFDCDINDGMPACTSLMACATNISRHDRAHLMTRNVPITEMESKTTLAWELALAQQPLADMLTQP